MYFLKFFIQLFVIYLFAFTISYFKFIKSSNCFKDKLNLPFFLHIFVCNIMIIQDNFNLKLSIYLFKNYYLFHLCLTYFKYSLNLKFSIYLFKNYYLFHLFQNILIFDLSAIIDILIQNSFIFKISTYYHKILLILLDSHLLTYCLLKIRILKVNFYDIHLSIQNKWGLFNFKNKCIPYYLIQFFLRFNICFIY